MTSNDLKRSQSTSNGTGKKLKTKNNLKGGFFHDNVEIDDQYLDEVLDNNWYINGFSNAKYFQ